jgi:signal transduction histidine kinase
MRTARPAPAWAASVFLLLLACLCFVPAAASAQEDEDGKNVLLVYSHEQEALMYARLNANLRATLRTAPGSRVEFYTEYLDALRFPEAVRSQKTVDYLRVKYADLRVDLIVAVSPPAFDFVLQRGATLFPGVPVVFTSVSSGRIESTTLAPNFTGIAVKSDITSTLEVALQLQPETSTVVVPVGTSLIEKQWTNDLRTSLKPYDKRVTFNYLGGLSMHDMLERLASLPPRTIVLFSPLFFHDATGQYYAPEEALELICKYASAPVYGTVESFLGLGIVGGRLYDLAEAGSAAGELGRQVLSGILPSSLPVQTIDPNPYLFDARQLRRWGLDESRLPMGSQVRFREPSIWNEYRWRIISVLALCALQAISLVALVAQNRRRAVLERESKTQRAELAHLARVSLMGELSGSLAHELNQPLTAILSNAQAAQRFLQAPTPNLAVVNEILADIVADDRRAGSVIQRLRAMLKKGEAPFQRIQVGDVVNEVLRLVRADLVAHDVTITTDIADDLPAVEGDRIQLQQVLLNLIVNAADAMAGLTPHHRQILVRVSVGARTVEVAVTDNGKGVPPDQLGRIFEPFVTTKSEGLGMGLAISRTIIEYHDGRLWAGNNADYGATFHVSLPAATGRSHADEAAAFAKSGALVG